MLLPSSQTLKHCGNFISPIVSSTPGATLCLTPWDAQQTLFFVVIRGEDSFLLELEFVISLPPVPQVETTTHILIGSGLKKKVEHVDLWMHPCRNMKIISRLKSSLKHRDQEHKEVQRLTGDQKSTF